MGKLLLVWRLAGRDLRRRRLQAILLFLVIMAAMSTLTLGLVLHGVSNNPYMQTRAVTVGPDVVASSVGYGNLARFRALTEAPGVIAHSGPYPVAWPILHTTGVSADVMVEGRRETPAPVDQPKVVQGSWIRPGGIVVERSFADALGIHLGDIVTLGRQPFRVVGIAVTAAVPVYSQVCFYGGCGGPAGEHRQFDTGLVWVAQPAAGALASPANPLSFYLNLRLADPAAAQAFVDAHQPPPTNGPPPLTAWQTLRTASGTLVAQERKVLSPASWLLALLAVASVAVVAGGRMAEQEKRVGLLKAAGGTPALAATVLLAEHGAITLAGAGAGLLAGWLTAPLLASPGASLIGSPAAPSLTASTILLVVAAAVAVAAASTVVPALRAARTSTVAALAGSARPPGRRAWLIKASGRLPVPLLLGLRLVARRPRRTLLSAASFTLTATSIVAMLSYHATIISDLDLGGPYAGAPDPSRPRITEVLLVFTIVMIVLALANTIFTTWASVIDARRFSAIVRSLGATPKQIVGGLVTTQALPATTGALIGIPAGTALYTAVQNGGPHGTPQAWWLVTMILVMLLTVAGLTAWVASIGAHEPAAAVLQTDNA